MVHSWYRKPYLFLPIYFDLSTITRIFEYQFTRVMTTKLTLTIEGEVIDSAKEYARKEGKSLSSLVENYLRAVTSAARSAAELSPKVSKLMGAISLPEDFDYKKELGNAIAKKYKH